MGYSTKFSGQFLITPTPSADVIIKLRSLEGEKGTGDQPDSYCQWQLSKDCSHIEWDSGEKFYLYVEWLQWIIDNILTPAGLALSGTVQYSGEDTTDVGVLTIADGKVIQKKLELVSDDLAELIRFKKFVIEHPNGYEILDDWRRLTQ